MEKSTTVNDGNDLLLGVIIAYLDYSMNIIRLSFHILFISYYYVIITTSSTYYYFKLLCNNNYLNNNSLSK